MSDVLKNICLDKRVHIEGCRLTRPIEQLERDILDADPPKGFKNAILHTLQEGRYPLIAEIKKASPSKGLIREDFHPELLALDYLEGGATCLSVLTDKPYFQGEDAFLSQARQASGLPCLRKDFMLDDYQIFEARALGADCILLIMAALELTDARSLAGTAHALGMDVLVEVHNQAELEHALYVDADLIGINNRNLKTLQVDLATTETLAAMVPKGQLLVAESGIHNHADLRRMADAGAHAFLVGESLMRQEDLVKATRELLGLPVEEG